MLIDSSIIIPVFRDNSGTRRSRFRQFLRGRDFSLTRFTQLELLQGCQSVEQWDAYSDYLDDQTFVEASPSTWSLAALIRFELKCRGITIRNAIDCCIAQIAIEERLLLVHNDRDFDRIAEIRPLRLRRLDIQ